MRDKCPPSISGSVGTYTPTPERIWLDDQGYTTEEAIVITEFMLLSASNEMIKKELEEELRILRDRQFEELIFHDAAKS